ncbi:23S rRNA pseudouridine1911/1915/1917 synthase [Sedimentibacter acidaminivorans]|jgi:23S rRNA pseudouridine1911/1915/1917 synthase|uniref:Pseudouridine synthase n=1 Tax=Sedimentibacter acidaminivorans TaxID=913099 RepID=A0ABS4GDB5_9FIRM|nr:RluA family pseudouridine synthase [Sedimentibacter acidaminivorans]MBP1925691.1 23S rRNA pseudouridine1911/1915/1917 synthase [Sedimentibacter acidaminivorans]
MINNNNDNIINYTIQENDRTVKKIMTENLKFSKRLSKKLELAGKILLNEKPSKLNKSVFKGDVLSLEFNDEEDEYNAVNIPIEIIYEDSDMLIINKPPYIVVHPTKSHQDNTIANGVAYYFKQKGIRKKVRFVNRLDMNTSGIVIIAKNPYIHNELANQMKLNTVEKYYYAIVEGLIKEDKGTINEPIGRLNAEDIIRVVDPSGKECITHYEVKGRFKDKTLVKLKLETGRTHQIRVHMKHIGHPVLGDTLYGSESKEIKRQSLHCYEMIFVHPTTGKNMTIKCELPDDMRKLI